MVIILPSMVLDISHFLRPDTASKLEEAFAAQYKPPYVFVALSAYNASLATLKYVQDLICRSCDSVTGTTYQDLYLDCKAAAVLHTSAVLVGPAVPLRGEELLDEVCVVRVYFDRVKAALEGEVRRDLVVFDALLYLFL